MLLDVNSILILFALGLFAGVVNTLAGGGSLVTLPVLILFLGLDEATANGTNRLLVIQVEIQVKVVIFYIVGEILLHMTEVQLHHNV